MRDKIEEIILDFWRCSLKNDFSEFDFDKAFNEYEPFLHTNCIEHAQGTFEEYVESTDQIYGLNYLEKELDKISGLCYCNDWYSFTSNDALMAILKAQYNVIRKTFETEVHGSNAKLLKRIQNRKGLTEPELISLFDEAIHAQHLCGDILEDVDVESLREEAEREFKKENKFPTEIRKFL